VVDAQQHARLLAMKLGALVRDHAGEAPVVLGVFAAGAGLVRGDDAWVLAEEHPERSLGPALAWARQQGASRLQLVADEATGTLARRAAYFASRPGVWRVDGRDLVEVEPAPLPVAEGIDPGFVPLVGLIEEAGAEPLVEHGALVGEVRGLEVCRATRDSHSGAVRLEVGVGAHDREAFQLVHGDVPPADALADVVRKVTAAREPGAPNHPLNRLGAERLVRWRLVQEPGLVGASVLFPAASPVPRPNLKDAVPCVATGVDGEGRPLVVVCSVGVDLDLVPFAADARAAHGGDGVRLLLALAERDVHPVTQALNAQLHRPAEVAVVPPAAAPA
jgi:hypothetical protein